MRHPPEDDQHPRPQALPHAPEELTVGRLDRLGEGIGRVVYASPHWVVKRERSPSEIVALILIWKILRRIERHLPGRHARRLLESPSRQIRILRRLMQAVVLVIPRGLWFTTHIGETWRMYRRRDVRGHTLARIHLAGTHLVPERITFPPTRVKVGGWPGWLTVSEATERVETTLDRRLAELAGCGRFDELEEWLSRFLDLRCSGWRRGLFSVDAHLKNFGVTGERVVLIDPGGLTDRWSEIARRLDFEGTVEQPHLELGLGSILRGRPDIADRFNARWKATVNPEEVRRHWPNSKPA